MNVTATLDPGPRLVLTFDFADQFATSGALAAGEVNLTLDYRVTLASPYQGFTTFTTRLVDGAVNNPPPSPAGGLVLAHPAVFDADLTPVFTPLDGVYIDKHPVLGGEELELSGPLGFDGEATVQTLFALFGEDEDHTTALNLLTQEFDLTVIPEPGTLGLAAAGLALLLAAGRTPRAGRGTGDATGRG